MADVGEGCATVGGCLIWAVAAYAAVALGWISCGSAHRPNPSPPVAAIAEIREVRDAAVKQIKEETEKLKSAESAAVMAQTADTADTEVVTEDVEAVAARKNTPNRGAGEKPGFSARDGFFIGIAVLLLLFCYGLVQLRELRRMKAFCEGEEKRLQALQTLADTRVRDLCARTDIRLRAFCELEEKRLQELHVRVADSDTFVRREADTMRATADARQKTLLAEVRNVSSARLDALADVMTQLRRRVETLEDVAPLVARRRRPNQES